MAHPDGGGVGDMVVNGQVAVGMSLMQYDDKKPPTGGVQPEGPAKRRRVWTEGERQMHKQACSGKQKLTYGEKMEIIRRHESADADEHRTQAQLAEMFGKSRSAISKILRPDAMERIKATAAAGIDHQVKRYFPPEHPELERRLYQRIEQSFRKGVGEQHQSKYTVGSQTLCANAEQIAKEMGIESFKPTAGWYSRFVKRYGLAKPPSEDGSQGGILPSGGQGPMSGGANIVVSHVVGGQSLGLQIGGSRIDHLTSRGTKVTIVPFKAVWLGQNGSASNTRRLDVPLELDEHNTMISGFETTMNILRQTFQQELMTSQARVSYTGPPPPPPPLSMPGPVARALTALGDELVMGAEDDSVVISISGAQDDEGDDVVISSDAELSLAINLHKGMHGGTVKLTLSPIMQHPPAVTVPMM